MNVFIDKISGQEKKNYWAFSQNPENVCFNSKLIPKILKTLFLIDLIKNTSPKLSVLHLTY